MNHRLFSLALLFALPLWLGACDAGKNPKRETAHGETKVAAAVVKGPHGGRMLTDGDFALELTIFERGVPPEFRLYPQQAGKPLPLAEVQARIELRRIDGLPGGVIDEHVFAPQDDYLLSPAEVYEPHSFAVQVTATHAGTTHEWRYDSPEGAVVIAADMAAAAGMETAPAGGGMLRETLALYGSIQPNPERMRDVTARFPGIARSVAVRIGDLVRAGQTLATIESNESLQVYEVAAPIAGTIVTRAINPGESAGAAPLFGIADFSSVQAELNVFPRDRGRLGNGQAVAVAAADGVAQGIGRIGYIAPVGTGNQALTARVVLDNQDRRWTPGQFVNAQVTVGETPVALLVPVAALQSLRDWDVVFVADGDHFQAQPVALGRSDGVNVEVLSGLKPGARIVIANSYLVKADIEKSGASHDH